MTVEQLTHEFLNNYGRKRLRPTTLRGYTVNVENHILPELGDVESSLVTPADLDDLTEALREKTLSNRTIIYVHATLRKTFNYAIKYGYLMCNPYDRWEMLKPESFDYTVLTEQQMSQVLDTSSGDPYLDLAIRLALRYGLRRGEILGIMPHLDLDLKNRSLHIQRTRTVVSCADVVTPCKTDQSNRYVLLLPEDAAVLSCLWNNTGYAVPLTPTQLNKRFKAFLYVNGLPPIRFHDLRHSYATLMLRKGVNPKIVSSVLGHSGVGITLDIYSHPDVSMQQICLEVLP